MKEKKKLFTHFCLSSHTDMFPRTKQTETIGNSSITSSTV
uniref:Uncharacterized protein n=1 Tax=Rhizophora mucronata TaxID=61149 RepID=A0A2P2QIY9_RHIMU